VPWMRQIRRKPLLKWHTTVAVSAPTSTATSLRLDVGAQVVPSSACAALLWPQCLRVSRKEMPYGVWQFPIALDVPVADSLCPKALHQCAHFFWWKALLLIRITRHGTQPAPSVGLPETGP
jgi:hypothetical protein